MVLRIEPLICGLICGLGRHSLTESYPFPSLDPLWRNDWAAALCMKLKNWIDLPEVIYLI